MSIFNRRSAEEDEEGGKAVEAKFAENIAKTIKETVAASSAAQQTTIDSLANTIKTMNDRFAREDQDRAKAAELARREAAKPKTAEEEAEMLLNDPAGYTQSKMEPTTRLALITNAKLTRNEQLTGKPYYFGAFKTKVDQMIDSSNDLAQRSNPSYIENCYKIILADHMEEIQSGKLKQTQALQSFSDGSNSGKTGAEGGKHTVEYRDQKTKYAAQMMGVSDDDLIEVATKQAIRGLEFVGA